MIVKHFHLHTFGDFVWFLVCLYPFLAFWESVFPVTKQARLYLTVGKDCSSK